VGDIGTVSDRMKAIGARDRVEIAFGGDIRLEDMAELKAADVDVLDIGRAIIDAPLLDLKYEVRGKNR
jgi:nicotinate-nucleotide pyrophosphorylase (carboxylating)